jgi:hypothetical protein
MKIDFVHLDELKSSGKSFLNFGTKFLLDKAIKDLQKIEVQMVSKKEIDTVQAERILSEYWLAVGQSDDKFVETYSNRRKKNELLLVFNHLYGGKRISTDKSLAKVIQLFAYEKSEVILSRWISVLTNFWEDVSASTSNFDAITSFLRYKLDNSPLKLRRLNLLNNNRELFLNRDGAHRFAQRIIDNKSTHSKYCEVVGMRFENSQYHAAVTVELFEYFLLMGNYSKAVEIVEGIADSPENYSVRSRKKILSMFIVYVEEKSLSEYKELAKKTAFRADIIGDPNKLSAWTVWEGGSQSDKAQMSKARLILNKWILTSFVDVFFNHLINDPKRRAYWLEKIPLISSVKVFGSNDIVRILRADERIRPYVDRERFKLVRSSGTNAGILMELGNYQIVEFTDSGALYCYKKINNRIPQHLYSISDLKHPHMEMACSTQPYGSQRNAYALGKTHYLNEEGRIVHSGASGRIRNGEIVAKDSWMIRMDLWIRTFVK